MIKIDFVKGIKYGIALSGGVDSMVLLHLAKEKKADFIAIHIEHGIRGKESIDDLRFLEDYCSKNNIELLTFSVDVPGEKEKSGDSIELVARKMRYAIFENILESKKVDVIATAHHLGDQTETILMRVFRGTGIRGLIGIHDSEKYVHPLLNYTKNDILAYANSYGIEYRTDKTNLENIYTRNYIRNELLPLIRAMYPQIDSTLMRLSETCSETDKYLKSQSIKYSKDKDIFYLPVSIKELDRVVIKYSITQCLRAMGILQDIESKHLENIIALLDKDNSKKIDLPCDIKVYKENERLVFIKAKNHSDFIEDFDINNSYECECGIFSFLRIEDKEYKDTFDFEKLPENLTVRKRQDGDKFKPCNGTSKLLSDYLQEKRVPLRQRDDILLMAKEDTIYAVLGIEISDLIKIDEDTKTVYKIIRREKCIKT